jgi:hypothetical protein
MSATITKGYSFVQGGTCNAAHLHAEIESATIAGVDRGNIDRVNVCPITLSSSAPAAPVDKELWQNSTTMMILAWDNHFQRWMPTSINHVLYTVDSGSAAISAGNSLKITNGFFSLADGGLGALNVVAIAAHDAVAGGYIVAAVHGIVRAKVTGTVVAGDLLQLSATAGVLQSGAGSTKTIARVLDDAIGGLAWINLKR